MLQNTLVGQAPSRSTLLPRKYVKLAPKLFQEFDAECTHSIRDWQEHDSVDIRNRQKHKSDAAGGKSRDDNSHQNDYEHTERKESVSKKIEELKLNPEHFKPLRGFMKGERSIHFGPFVMTFEID